MADRSTQPTSFGCSGTRIEVGDDLDALVNADPASSATTFCLEAGTHEVDEIVTLKTGDKLLGPEGEIVARGPASYGVPTARIKNAASLPRLIQVSGTNIELGWFEISGAIGKYDDKPRSECDYWSFAASRCPAAGTGAAIAARDGGGTLYVHHLEIHGNDALGIASANGRILHSNLYDNTQNPDFLGFTGAAMKGIDEFEAAHNYVHDEQGMGIWCDHGCNDVPGMRHGFWAHDNLVVDNAGWGIRYEFSPRLPDGVYSAQPTALIEDNEIHGNGVDGGQGGASMHDAQNGTFSGNDFGAETIAGVRYASNAGGKAIDFAWSDRGDRTDLWNGEAYGNSLGGETISGCNTGNAPDVVYCHDNYGMGSPPLLRGASIASALAVAAAIVLFAIRYQLA